MENEPEQDALFELQGPDEDGCVWACSPKGRDVWCQNLGPVDKVAEVMSQWLRSIDFDERDEDAHPITLGEVKKRLAKRSRKAARPEDHREEGGQG